LLIGKDKIREVVERTDIVQLIGRHVQLKRSGRSYKGLCPFHGERTPSFYVTPDRHSYKCFGCQKGGDAIRFLMEYEGKDFMTAVRELARDAGVPIVFDPEEDRRLAERRELLWACQVAARFFEEELWGPRGEAGRKHLAARGVSEATARAAGIGYAPNGYHALRDRLIREKVPVARAVAAGLLGLRNRDDDQRAENEQAYDIFRGRLMIPIRDPDRRVIAFGGRVVEGQDDRKYINSRETPLYVKSRVLYGLDVGRDSIRRSGEAVLVEGYFDAIALWEAGISNAVALCSTVLTPDHLQLLKRLEVRRIVLLLDGDLAGRKAVMRLAGPLLATGLATRVFDLPEGQDPDTFLAQHGRAGYEERSARAQPLSNFVIGAALGEKLETFEDKVRALGELRPVVAALPEDAARSLFFAEIARRLEIGADDVDRFFRGDRPAPTQATPSAGPGRPGSPPPGPGPGPGPFGPGGPARGPAPRRRLPGSRRELELVACLLAEASLVPTYAGPIAAAISDDGLREVVGLLQAGELEGEEILARLEGDLAGALHARVREARRHSDKDWRQEIDDGLLQLELERLQIERKASIDEREALETMLARATEPAEREELESSLEECSRQIGQLRDQMEQLRARLRGAA